jgi:UDP-N-acetylmuramyl pentapeptide phosphotransferase/UDP-N-acetylglucosamine-1-phosphate transferase
MLKTIIIIFYPFFIYLVNFFLTKKNLLPNYSGDNHQKFFNKNKIQLSGGIFLIPIFFIITYDHSIILIISISSIFLLGLFSDIGFFSSAKLRFLIQSVIIFLFLFYSNTTLTSVRIDTFDLILENYLFSLFFTLFCLMILINGTNFIDGLNGLVLTYYLIIIFIIFNLKLFEYSFLNNLDVILIMMILIYLILFNIFNQLYIGDSGSYLIGFLFGYLLLQIYESNQLLSPYFIALLLWYPAFEILFSIIRKINFKKSPFKPDNKHFHHLLFLYIYKKFKFNNNISNNLSALVIILYNTLIFLIAVQNIHYTVLQVSLLIFNASIYLILYLKLNQFQKL